MSEINAPDDTAKPNLAKLRKLLETYPAGSVEEDDYEVTSAVRAAWPEIRDTEAESTEPWKLLDRMKNLRWSPAVFSFEIVRHGILMLGSIYNEVLDWHIDVVEGTSSYSKRRVQSRPRAPNMDVRGPAREIADVIVNQRKDPRVRWSAGPAAQVLMKTFINAGNKRTREGRYNRFRTELDNLLAQHGWSRQKGCFKYTKQQDIGSPENIPKE